MYVHHGMVDYCSHNRRKGLESLAFPATTRVVKPHMCTRNVGSFSDSLKSGDEPVHMVGWFSRDGCYGCELTVAMEEDEEEIRREFYGRVRECIVSIWAGAALTASLSPPFPRPQIYMLLGVCVYLVAYWVISRLQRHTAREECYSGMQTLGGVKGHLIWLWGRSG